MVVIKHHQVKPEIFDNPIFSIQLKAIRLFGFIIGTNQRYPLWHFIRCTFFTCSFVVFVVLMFIRVFRGIHILEADFILRPTTICGLSNAIHVVNAYFQRKRVVRLVNFLHEDLLCMRSCSDDLEDEIFNKTVKYLRRLSYVFIIPVLMDAFLACLDCLAQTILYPDVIYTQVLTPQKINFTARPIMLFDAYPFGEVLNIFVMGYVGPYYAMLLNCFTVSVLHTFNASLLKFVIFKIELLSKRLSEMDITKIYPSLKSKVENDQLNKHENICMHLKLCKYFVQEQIKIRWFTKELEQFFRIPIFMDFLIFSVLICTLLYTILTGHLSITEYLFSVVFIFVMAGYQLLYHWHATIVTKSHEAMCYAVYSCDWYNYPLKAQKSIRFMMMDSKRPLVMCAFIFELKLETVLDIFRGAFSYFSILRNLNTHG